MWYMYCCGAGEAIGTISVHYHLLPGTHVVDGAVGTGLQVRWGAYYYFGSVVRMCYDGIYCACCGPMQSDDHGIFPVMSLWWAGPMAAMCGCAVTSPATMHVIGCRWLQSVDLRHRCVDYAFAHM